MLSVIIFAMFLGDMSPLSTAIECLSIKWPEEGGHVPMKPSQYNT